MAVNNILRAEKNGYQFCGYSEFLRLATSGLSKRARDLALQFRGASCVLWDPHDDDDGFLLVGDSWTALADEWASFVGEEYIS